jgi:hypothetical protein
MLGSKTAERIRANMKRPAPTRMSIEIQRCEAEWMLSMQGQYAALIFAVPAKRRGILPGVAIHMLRIKGDQGIPSTPPFALFLCVEGL